jgi:hypothetical protein
MQGSRRAPGSTSATSSRRTLRRDGLGALAGVDAILVPGGFGERGIEGKISAVRFARERRVPYLGICLGLQVAVIEFARNVAGCPGPTAPSSTRHPGSGHRSDHRVAGPRRQHLQARSQQSDLGGTMRLGAQDCRLQAGTLARRSLRPRRRSASATATATSSTTATSSACGNAGLVFLGLLGGRPRRDDRTAGPPLVPGLPVPPGVPLQPA